MTMKHVIEGLMKATDSRSHYKLTIHLNFPQGTVTRLANGKSMSMNMANLVHVHNVTGISFDTLFDWYRLPTGAVLGRVA